MNVIIYYEQFSFGGVDKHLCELVNNWKNKKDNITIVTNRNNKGFQKIRNSLKKTKIVYFNSYSYSYFIDFLYKNNLSFLRFLSYFFQPIFLFLSIGKFIFLLKDINKNTIVMSSNGSYPGSWANIAIILAAKFCKIRKRILLIHHESSYSNIISWVFAFFIDKILSRSLTHLICVSKATLNTIKKRRNLNYNYFKTQIIHNDIKILEKNLKKKLFVSLKKKYCLFGILGRADAYKGHEDVLYAISQIDLKYRNKIKLMLIGLIDFGRKKFLKDLSIKLGIKENIIFTGYLSSDSQIIINNLDVVIMSTRDFEGFGYTALEAIKLGKPLITTDVGAIREFVDPRYAEIIKPKKVKEFALVISKIISRIKYYKKRAAIYKKKYNKKFEVSETYRSVFVDRN
jgi:glycosyltransferase involved in cell wall biosynthesis